MRALVIRQPWASLIAAGRKTIETRGRPTQVRGPILIVAGKHRGIRAEQAILDWVQHDTLRYARDLPRGVALAVVDIMDCRRLGWWDMGRGGGSVLPAFDDLTRRTEDGWEWVFDLPCYSIADRWAWVLADIRPIPPFPVRGQVGWFDVPYPQEAP